ncbi:hypothetical protein GCM10028791_38580 [Echinicola sediminis]
MKKVLLSPLFGLLVFFTAYFISSFTLEISKDHSLWGFGALLGFVLLFITIVFYNKKFSPFLSSKGIVFLSLFGVLLFTFLNSPSLRFSTKVFPSTICYLLGILAASIYSSDSFKKRYLYTFLLFIIPFSLNLNLYSTWVHWVEFGNVSGAVENQKTIPFEVSDEAGNIITNEDVKGNIVLLDFWFISCGPCWKKFPKLQDIYEKYGENPSVKIFAVNRPMASDNPGQSFASIKNKGYTFPVLQGTQKVMDDFDIYVYPTVVLLDQEGKVAFMGKIEDVEENLQKLLND